MMPPHRKKILYLATRLNVGGITPHVVTLAAASTEHFDVVLAAGEVERDEEDMSDLASTHSLEVVRVPGLRRSIRLLHDIRAFFALYSLFKRESPTIVSTFMFKARFLGALAARAARVPVIVETFNGTLFEGYFRGSASRLLRWAERLVGHRLVHHVVATTASDARIALAHDIAPRERITHVAYGFDLELFATAAEEESNRFRDELQLAEDDLIVGIVGRLTEIKGHRIFLQAISLLGDGLNEGCHFVIVGDGELRAELEKLSGDLGVDHLVRFLGTRRDMPSVYADLDLLVVSSLNEGTCIVIAEAMAAGTAVVATEVGGVPELVTDGVTGLLVPPADPSILASALTRILTDGSLRGRLAEAGRRNVLESLTVERMYSATRAVYESLT